MTKQNKPLSRGELKQPWNGLYKNYSLEMGSLKQLYSRETSPLFLDGTTNNYSETSMNG